ncbi:hypothetical protein GCM10022209_43840 [Chitinophaga oryziterrae]
MPQQVSHLFLTYNAKVMKKESVKKLSLGKIKIAKLNTTQSSMQHANAPTYTGCSLLKCIPPPVAQY